ncbi:uncharacterized protein LOC144638851 isoform X2 [Oculina patagonica]
MSSSRNSKEEDSTPSDEALQKASHHMKELFDILKHETDRVRMEKEALDEAAKKLEHVHFSKMVKLNVGGHFFSTSLETLTKDAGSMLHAMFSGRFETKPSEDGSYFIDRDGTHFRYILNYLRTGQLIVPEDKIIRRELLAEAEFYQVEGMINDLRAGSFKSSLILSSDQCQTLMNWLNGTLALTSRNLVPYLAYRTSRNGLSATNFHMYCDNKGPTVTVIKSGNYIFGGYTDQHWDGSGAHKKAPASFLFSLVNPSGLPPTKMPLIAGKEGYAIYCNISYGPTFGGGSNYDLYIPNAPNSNNCSVNLNNAYQCPAGQNPTTFLAGNQNFNVSEMEVYAFSN